MPTYEYRCESCQGVFEKEHSIRWAVAMMTCPLCGKMAEVTRLISRGNFVLKGFGWAKDGYK